jgi:hypothetical protein
VRIRLNTGLKIVSIDRLWRAPNIGAVRRQSLRGVVEHINDFSHGMHTKLTRQAQK